MKSFLLLIHLAGLQFLLAQQPQQKGDFMADLIYKTADYPNEKNQPYLSLYFNAKGQPTEEWSYGKFIRHQADELDYVNTSHYDTNGLTTKEQRWYKEKRKFRTGFADLYTYDSNKNKVTDTNTEKGKTTRADSISYTYDSNKNILKKTSSYICYHTYANGTSHPVLKGKKFWEYKYDTNNRVIYCAFYDYPENLYSECRYTYKVTDSTLVKKMAIHFTKGNESDYETTTVYSLDNSILQIENIPQKGDARYTKKVFHYNPAGLMERIETSEKRAADENYGAATVIHIKAKAIPVNKEAIKNMNNAIIEPYL